MFVYIIFQAYASMALDSWLYEKIIGLYSVSSARINDRSDRMDSYHVMVTSHQYTTVKDIEHFQTSGKTTLCTQQASTNIMGIIGLVHAAVDWLLGWAKLVRAIHLSKRSS